MLGSLAGCGDQTGAQGGTTIAEGDPDYYFSKVAQVRSLGLEFSPDTLVGSLPNQLYAAPGQAKGEAEYAYSDVVVAGTVIDVRPDYGYVSVVDGDRESAKEVSFEDPAAEGRSVQVSVVVYDVAGDDTGIRTGDTVRFQVGVLTGAKPQEFMEALQGLDDIVVVLATLPDGPRQGDYYPVQQGGLLGVVEDGTVRFPGLGDDSARFTEAIDTLDELLRAAEGPVTKHESPGTRANSD